MTHRLLLSEAGGALTNGVIESLLMLSAPPYMVGVSSDALALQMSKADENHLVPPADDADFIPTLNQIAVETEAELIISQHDSVIKVLSERRDELSAPVFLPRDEVVKLCQDKHLSNQRWEAAGLKVPRAFLLTDVHDLDEAFHELGPNMWLRATHGGFGKGALPTGILENPDPGKTFRFAKLWIDAQHGWGHFQAAERLTDNSVTWLSIWKDGELVVAQGRKRHYWKYGNRNLSGVTGITGAGETVSDELVDDIALRAIEAVDDCPHGIYSVDLTYDHEGVPNPTEINIGRFFTTHRFFAAAGLNVADLLVRLAFEEPLPPLPKKINPLEPGLLWAREMDSQPALFRRRVIEKYETRLAERLTELKGVMV